ncbi:hypothetical protein CVT25_007555, partial [Psilocybe cyanescens]
KKKAIPEVPCPGLSDIDNALISTYLRRTSATGGGGKLLYDIAKERYKKVFSKLGAREKEQVVSIQGHGHQWKNDHKRLKIFSTSCEKNIPNRTPNQTPPCTSCSLILSLKSFKEVLRKPPPLPGKEIYTNKLYRNETLGQIYARHIGLKEIIESPDAKNTPCVRYTLGVLSGKFNHEVLSGLIEAIMQKQNRVERGVGMQNFAYAPAWDEFSHLFEAFDAVKLDNHAFHKPSANKPFN